MNDIVELITRTGFPIVACIFIAKYFAQTIKDFRQDVKDLTAQYASALNDVSVRYSNDISGMTEALHGNTLVQQRILDKLDMDMDPDQTSGRKAG